jgi:hypothetical protein
MMELLIKAFMTECLIASAISFISNKFEFDNWPAAITMLAMIVLMIDAVAILITLISMIWSW